VNHLPLGQIAQNWGLVRCTAGFFLGTLTYQAYAKLSAAPSARAAPPWAWLSAATFVGAILFLSLLNMRGRRAFALPPIGALLILSLVLSPSSVVSRVLGLKPFVLLGTVSYSIYMVHAAVLWPVLELLFVGFKYPRMQLAGREFVDMPPAVGLAVLAAYVGIVLLVSHFTFGAIEVRFRNKAKQLAAQWWGSSAPTPNEPDKAAGVSTAELL
jgi:peptidoglycan/LPS O-acetylase OafA/YrhL